MFVRERAREGVYERERGVCVRERLCVCVRESGLCVCVCVCEREGVCVCMRERGVCV